MKMRCLICKQERILSPDEIKEYGEWIENKKLQSVDYLKRLSLDDGYNCGDGKKQHKYEFEEEWDKEIHTVAKEIKETGETRAITLAKTVELDSKIKEMIKMKEEGEKKVFELDKKCGDTRLELEKMTGNKKYEIWV